LESADAGDFQPFQDFILNRCLDTIGLVDASLQCAIPPSADQSLAAIQALYFTRGGYTYEQVDQAGMKLIEVLQDSLRTTFVRLQGTKISFQFTRTQTRYPLPPGYRFPVQGNGLVFQVILQSSPPAQAAAVRNMNLLLPVNATGDDDVKLADTNNPHSFEPLIARMDELIPAISGVSQIRINMFAERLCSEMLAELRAKAEESLGKRP
jgi:hypothetical protein